MRLLIAMPIYNEARTIESVLHRVQPHAHALGADLLAVNDGSTDGSARVLERLALGWPRLRLLRHPVNRGYGAAIASAFRYAVDGAYEGLITMDSDGQHDPVCLPRFVAALAQADIVSGSRYLGRFAHDTAAPGDRRRINRLITEQINRELGLKLSDAFCGYKAYRVEALRQLCITEMGWGMPLQVWVQAARLGLRVVEVAVPRLYLDGNRRFGGSLDDEEVRLAYYRRVLAEARANPLPAGVGQAAGAGQSAGVGQAAVQTPGGGLAAAVGMGIGS
jgi:glycosyltransferase involved in cell wall biosynthesis